MQTIYLPSGNLSTTPKQMCKRGLNKAQHVISSKNRIDYALASLLSTAKTASNREKRNANYKVKRTK